jgi:hypothetical protein
MAQLSRRYAVLAVRSSVSNRLWLVLATLAPGGLVACSSEAPETTKHPVSHAGVMQVAAQGYAPPPPPPQPSYQPVLNREPLRAPGSDGTLATMVESALAAEPELNRLDIDVTAVEGTVYLRGHARTRDSRRLATQVAGAVDGVKRVQNELFVMAGS